jgi:hypothetical protein
MYEISANLKRHNYVKFGNCSTPIHFLSYFPNFEKSRLMRSPCCLCVVYISLSIL